MNNCLVTKLKTSVNNEDLSKLNVLTIKTKASDSPTLATQWIGFGASENGSVSINSPSVGLYQNGISGALIPYPIIVPAGAFRESHFENKAGIIEVTDKYNLKMIVGGNNATFRIKEIYGIPGTISDLAIRNSEEGEIDVIKLLNSINISQLTRCILPSSVNIINRISANRVAEFISINNINPSFNSLFKNLRLNDLANNVNVMEIHFGSLIGGNLSSFAKMTKLNSIIFLKDYQNTGDIMDFINPWIQAGRTSGKLKTLYITSQTNITLNGSQLNIPEGSISSNGACYINWTSDGTVTFTAS